VVTKYFLSDCLSVFLCLDNNNNLIVCFVEREHMIIFVLLLSTTGGFSGFCLFCGVTIENVQWRSKSQVQWCSGGGDVV